MNMYITTGYRENAHGEVVLTFSLTKSQRLNGKPMTTKNYVGTMSAKDFMEHNWGKLEKAIDARLDDEKASIFRGLMPKEAVRVKVRLGYELTKEETELLGEKAVREAKPYIPKPKKEEGE